MMSLNFSKYFFIIFFCIFTSFLNGQLYRYRSPEILSPKDKGMGGSHTATGNDFYLLWANPALIANEKRFLKIHPKATIYQIFNIELGIPYSFIPSLTKVTSSFTELTAAGNSISGITETTRIIDRLPLGIYTQPLLNFGVIGHRWGFSLASHSEFFLTVAGQLPSIHLDISAGFDAKFGFSPLVLSLFEKDDFKTGIAIKGLGFIFSKPSLSTPDLLSIFSDFKIDSLIETVLQTQTTGVGVGLDTGILFDFSKNFTLGIAIIDTFTPFYSIEREDINNSIETLSLNYTYSILYPNVKMGLAYRFPEHPFFFLKNGVLSFDLHHLYDDTYTIGKKLHIGASVDIFDLGFVGANTAAGFNQGYFTFSTTLKLPGLLFLIPPSYLSYTFYQKELGPYVNSFVRSLHIVSFSTKL